MKYIFPPMDRYISASRGLIIHIDRRIIPNAPRPLRAVFASDLHLRSEMDPVPLAECIAELGPDMILLGGDYADTRSQALRLFDAFRILRAPLGIFAVCGNNDREAFESHGQLAEALNAFGAELLVNRCAEAGGMIIGGVDEHRYGQPDYDAAFGNRQGYRLLLSHYPILPQSPAMPDLMLSGHTHGGQFNCLGLTPFCIGFERTGSKKHLSPALVSGMQTFGDTRLLVSKGVGMSRIPVRIGVCPEIHLLEFKC